MEQEKFTSNEPLWVISRALQKTGAVLSKYDNIFVSLSGGKDSDVMLDIILKVCPKDKLHFAFFDTGIEYEATHRHLNYLEEKYDIQIERKRATVPVPLGVRKYGLPFISKDVSTKINCLQNNNFDFALDGNRPYEELIEKYPRCKSAIEWWCNRKPKKRYNIDNQSYMKDFMIANPPTFKISSRCCDGAKKSPSHTYEKENSLDCKCLGLRKSEGGVRSTKYKSCYSFEPSVDMQNMRPIWWFTDETEQLYIQTYDLTLSDCYTKWGMQRTGCAGCPFNSKFETDLLSVKENEPKLYNAVTTIFKESYEYTRAYRDYRDKRRANDANS